MSVNLTIARGLSLLDMTSGERRLAGFINEHNSNGRFIAFQSPNLSEALAFQMDWNASSIRNVLCSLRDRGWVVTEIENGKPVAWLTKVLTDTCKVALHHRVVRSAAGLDFVRAFPDTNWDALWAEAASYFKLHDEMHLDPSQRDTAKTVRLLARSKLD